MEKREIKIDPRYFQLVCLLASIVFGLSFFNFDTTWLKVFISIVGSLGSQYLADHIYKKPKFNYLSALITGCSLSLLLRTNSLLFTFLATVLAIFAKFIFSYSGKHLFNPANFAITVLLFFDVAWISPGQWGNSFYLMVIAFIMGGMVTWKSLRYDVALVFLITFSAIVFSKSLWIGDPLAVPLHRLSSGSLLLFSFFMITDPRSAPNHPIGRYLFAMTVAIVGWWGQAKLFRPDSLFYALFIVSILSFVLDFIFKANTYRWEQPALR